jgi:hypothetical protein
VGVKRFRCRGAAGHGVTYKKSRVFNSPARSPISWAGVFGLIQI